MVNAAGPLKVSSLLIVRDCNAAAPTTTLKIDPAG